MRKFLTMMSIILLVGCASHPEYVIKQDPDGVFNGLVARSLSANIDVICDKDQQQLPDIITSLPASATDSEIFKTKEAYPLASASLHTGISTGLGVVAGAKIGASAGAGLTAGALDILNSGRGVTAYCLAVTFIKLPDGGKATDKQAFEKALKASYSSEFTKNYLLSEVDENEAEFKTPEGYIFKGEQFKTSATVKYTYMVSPELVKKLLPAAYSGSGRYAAYGIMIYSHGSGYPYGIYHYKNAHTTTALYQEKNGWSSYLDDNKSIELITRIVSANKQQTIIRKTSYGTLDTYYDTDNFNIIKLKSEEMTKEAFSFR
jgi:hypothetical protein